MILWTSCVGEPKIVVRIRSGSYYVFGLWILVNWQIFEWFIDESKIRAIRRYGFLTEK
jgi:hypothetical protein